MGRKSQEVSPGWLDPEKLIEFIDELRGADYNIGVSQYIAAQDLILALSTKGEQLDRPQRLRSLLGPLLCSSPAEQDDFQQRFDQWIERMGFTVIAPVHEDEKAKEFEQELQKIERRSQWFWWGLIAIAILAAITLIYFLIQQWLFTPSTPNGNGNSNQNFKLSWEWLLLLGALALLLLRFVTFLIWRLWRFLAARQYLKRRATRRQPEIQRVSMSGFYEELFPNVLFLRIAQGFRRRIWVPSNELDVGGTVEKTVRSGGRFTPVYRYRQVLPEYLVLVDRANYGDHQARFVQEMIDRLTQNEVFITGYYFDGDPRVCFPMRGKGHPRKLREIAAKYSQYRLIVFSDAEGFFSSLTGELEPWLERFSSWSERAVLTPKPSEHWGYQELELSRKFIVLPATSDGLIDLIRSIQYGESSYVPSEKSRAPFPEALRVRSWRWIEREPPESWLVAGVLESLRYYLGEAGYYWLSACAVFPELYWNLTVYLGNRLRTEDGKSSLLQACQLTDLARLPWFRYGYMPDWLRSCLIYELPRQQEDEVRKLLRSFLAAKPDEQGSVGKLQLEIAQQHSKVVSMLAQPLLRLLSNQASEDSPLRDYIFQEFMAGHKRLAVRMPQELRKHLLKHLLKHLRRKYRRRPTHTIDRIFAAPVYLLPLIYVLPFVQFLFRQFPIFSLIYLPLQPLISIYYGFPFARIITFFVLFWAVVRNDRISHFIRFNTMQAILLDIFLSFCRLLLPILMGGLGANLITETLYNVIFLGTLAACFYSIVQSALGRYAEIPIISDAAYFNLWLVKRVRLPT